MLYKVQALLIMSLILLSSTVIGADTVEVRSEMIQGSCIKTLIITVEVKDEKDTTAFTKGIDMLQKMPTEAQLKTEEHYFKAKTRKWLISSPSEKDNNVMTETKALKLMADTHSNVSVPYVKDDEAWKVNHCTNFSCSSTQALK